MHDDPPANSGDMPSELGAFEAIQSTSSQSAPQQEAFPCPSCGRMVEKGFRFCDGCGSSLEPVAPADVTQPSELLPLPGTPVTPKQPLLERWRRNLKERAQSGVGTSSVLGRWRQRRASRSEISEAERSLYAPPPRLEYDAPPRNVTGATSRPVPAEELRGVRPAIGGRLQWSEEQSEPPVIEELEPARIEQEDTVATWRPVAIPTQEEAQGGFRPWRFLLYVAIGFVSGAVALLVVTAIASLASDGTVAVLEMRGLPIFIGGAVSIVVFALLSTSRRTSGGVGSRRSSALVNVVAGLVVLVVLAAVVYQPGLAVRAQPRIDRALGIFGGADEEAVTGFEQDIVEWNNASDQYQRLLQVQLRRGIDFNRFRSRASDFERSLVDLVAQMRSRAGAAQNEELRDALGDLASIYEEEVGGLRVVNRGILVDNLDLVRTGDRHYKAARVKAGALFADRLRSLLDRAGYDSDAFGRALGG